MWLLYAFLAPAFFAIAEILDEFLSNKEFKNPLTLVFYASLFNLFYIAIFLIFSPPSMPPIETWPLFVGLSLVGVGYLYPYYKGLKYDDTSTAISFFAISRVFIPVIAFLMVGEVLEFSQYAGIGLIVISVFLLGLHHSGKKFKMSRAVWYIGLAAFLLAFEGVFFKLLFDKGVSVSTAMFGQAIISFFLGTSLLLFRRPRHDIYTVFPLFIKISPLFLVEELFTFLGQFMESTAISLTSVSVVKGITVSAPFFLIVYAWMGRGFFPSIFKEDLHKKKVLRKTLLFLILIIGILLVKE